MNEALSQIRCILSNKTPCAETWRNLCRVIAKHQNQGGDPHLLADYVDGHTQSWRDSWKEVSFENKDEMFAFIKDDTNGWRLTLAKTLQMPVCGLNHIELEWLLDQPWMCNVVDLGLSFNFLGECGALILGHHPHVQQLEHLYLCTNRIGDRGFEAIATGTIKRLRTLDLHSNNLTEKSLDYLLTAPNLRHVKDIDLGGRNSLEEYADLLRKRYPGKRVRF